MNQILSTQIEKLRALRSFFSLAYISSGFVAVFVGYAGAGAIIFQAASAAGATTAQINSWFWALGIGMGVSMAF